MARRKEPGIPDAVLNQLLAGSDARTAFDQGGLLDELKQAFAERALNAEMDPTWLARLGEGSSRNGYGRKSVVTDTGQIALEVPWDEQASFDPQLIAKYQRRFPGFDDKVVSMYARGMSTREITGHLRDLYGIEVSPDLISAVTDAVLEDVAAWQARPLEPVYPLVFFDALSDMKELLVARRGLVKDRVAASNRNHTHRAPLLKQLADQRLSQLERQIAAIDAALRALCQAHADLKARLDILVSIPAIGEATALALLIEMPELGTMDSKCAASLVGLAPVAHDSGQHSGKRFIRAGRAHLRQALYMPALVAIRFNADMKTKYQAIVAAGKPSKVAITAVMRKLLILANALLREHRNWTPKPA